MTDDWGFRRALARVEPVVEAVCAEHATAYVNRPVRRVDILPPRPLPGVLWSIDDEVVVQFEHRRRPPDRLLVHDVALLAPLRKQLRSRRIVVVHVSDSGAADDGA